MATYQRLTQIERYQIKALLTAGNTLSAIAQTLGRHKSTISRELCRNTGQRGYRPKQAHEKARTRQQNKPSHSISSATCDWVVRLIKQQWSPEQISGWLAETQSIRVSHEWIYQYLLRDKRKGGTLYQDLRCQRKRKKRYGANRTEKRGRIKGRVSIDDRPKIVDTRTRIGDWEADTVIGCHQGSKPVLVTLAERKSRFSLIIKASNKTATEVSDKLLQVLKPLKDNVSTITYDNGKEFAAHQTVSEALEATAYFAHPYHSWERGLNENMNGLIRQYFPKKTDFALVSDAEIEEVVNKLNNRPRKCLGWKTPNQVFFGDHQPVALES